MRFLESEGGGLARAWRYGVHGDDQEQSPLSASESALVSKNSAGSPSMSADFCLAFDKIVCIFGM